MQQYGVSDKSLRDAGIDPEKIMEPVYEPSAEEREELKEAEKESGFRVDHLIEAATMREKVLMFLEQNFNKIKIAHGYLFQKVISNNAEQ